MDAVEYLKEKNRMTKDCEVHCSDCLIGRETDKFEDFMSCTDFQEHYPEKAIEIVENWSKENPKKTYMMDLLEKYPNANIREKEKTPSICPSAIGFENLDCGKDGNITCAQCWNQGMEV